MLNTCLVLIIAINEARRPAAGVTWIILGLLLPVIGCVLYFILTNPKLIHQQRLASPQGEKIRLPSSFSPSTVAAADAIGHYSLNGIREGKAQILTNGIKTFEKLQESIKKAHSTIDLEYYLYRDDRIGRPLTDLLIQKASAGVRIRFMRDGSGSWRFPEHEILRMSDAGIECRTISPLRFSWLSSLFYRDHCKIVVIDGKEAFTGGINIGYEYTGLDPKIGYWRDTHMRIEGEASVDLLNVFQVHWAAAVPAQKGSLRPVPKPRTIVGRPYQTRGASERSSEWSTEWSTELSSLHSNTAGDGFLPQINLPQTVFVHTVESNPATSTPNIRLAYFICLTQAVRTVDLTTLYFLPEDDIIVAIKTAVARGVRVRLLVPRHAKPKIAELAGRTYYGELLEAGVEIFRYDKGELHAKLMVVDGEMSVVGSANYDTASLRLNYEVCQILYSKEISRQLTEQFERDLTNSTALSMEELLQTTYIQH